MSGLSDLFYRFCTDWMLAMANGLHLSYFEVNFLLFCVACPLTTAALAIRYAVYLMRLKRMQRMTKQ